MRKTISFYFKYFYFPVLILNVATAQSVDVEGYQITGYLQGLKSDFVVLQQQGLDYRSIYDTAVSVNGNFKLSGKVKEPLYAILWYESGKNGIIVYLENSKISIRGIVDDVERISIIGSKVQDEFDILIKRRSDISKNRSSVSDAYIRAISDNDTLTLRSLRRQIELLSDNDREVKCKFIQDYPDSFVSAYELRGLFNNLSYPRLFDLYGCLSERIKTSQIGGHIENKLRIARGTQEGSKAFEICQSDVGGKMVCLSDFEGKYVLIDFWASICAPCRAENKDLVEIYKKYQGERFEILGVSYDSDVERWKAAIKIDGLSWPNICDLRGIRNQAIVDYGVTSFPTNYLVDPHGIIIGKNLHGDTLHALLHKIYSH